MAWRFRRSVQVVPGVRVNLSKSGVSTTLGVKGAHATFGRGRVTNTVGVPGTGVSYSSTTRISTLEKTPTSWRRVWSFVGFIAFLMAVVCYLSGAPGAGTRFLVLAGVMAVFRWISRSEKHAPDQTQSADKPPQIQKFVPEPDIAGVAQRLADEHEQRLTRLRVEHEQRDVEEATSAARNAVLRDKIRVLLFLARADGAVRGEERDVMVRYLRSLSGLEDTGDALIKTMNAKFPRDLDDSIIELVGHLGSLGEIDEALIMATEGLTKLTKKISPAQLNVLTMLRHERARGPWRPAR